MYIIYIKANKSLILKNQYIPRTVVHVTHVDFCRTHLVQLHMHMHCENVVDWIGAIPERFMCFNVYIFEQVAGHRRNVF